MKDIKYAITKIKKHASLNKKISCIFLGNTVQKEKDSYYITPIRENKKFIFFSIILFNKFIIMFFYIEFFHNYESRIYTIKI